MTIVTTHKHKGVAIVWVAVLLIVFVAFIGLCIDGARIYLAGHQLHNAADAAALAGSRYVPMVMVTGNTKEAEQIAHNFANQNHAAKLPVYLDQPDADATIPVDTYISRVVSGAINPYDSAAMTDDVVVGRYIDSSQLFIVDHETPDSMLVVARRDGTASQPQLKLLFGPLFNVDTANAKQYAIAKVINPYGAGLLALGECPCPGIIFGSSDPLDPAITILGGGSLYVNSPYNPGGADGAVDQSGNAGVDIDIERMYVVGGIDDNFDYPMDADIHDYTEGLLPEPDPYASLPDHDIAQIRAMPDKGMISDGDGISTYSPGYYSGGLQINNTNVTLQPGDYYLDSIDQAASMYVSGGLVTGENVTLHIIGDADAGVNISGSANVDISAPTSGDYAGISIYEKRDPNYDCSQSCATPWSKADPISVFAGSGIIDIGGAVYMPHNRMELGGNGYISVTRIVADRFYIYGSSQKLVNYKGEPKIAPESYLVE